MSVKSLAASRHSLYSFSASLAVRQNKVAILTSRNIYTDRDTEIPGLGFHINNVKNKKRLPNFLESCPFMNQEEVEALYASFPATVEYMMSFKYVKIVPEANQRTKTLMEHSLCYTPYTAAQTVMAHNFYSNQRKALNKANDEEKRHFLACKLGWGIEMNFRQFSVLDDYINESKTRNGVPAWHTFPGNAIQASFDASILCSAGLMIIKKWLENLDCYGELLDLVYEHNFLILVSENQLLEMKHAQSSAYAEATTLEHVRNVKSLMNANGACVNAAVVSAMIFNDYNEPELMQLAKQIGNEVMICASIFDDYACCFGGFLVNEEEGRDIKNGKLTWLLIKSKELGSTNQCRLLKQNYGRSDPDCVNKVKRVYQDLNIGQVILSMAEEEASKLEVQISKLPENTFPSFIWLNLINHYRKVAFGTLLRLV